MKVSVVIPTLNEENYIGNLLRDLNDQTLKPFEILVVDGNSTDKTKEVVSKFSAIFLEGTPPVGSQRSQGGKIAEGELLVFLDADVRLKNDFLEKFADSIVKRNLGVACPLYFPYGKHLGAKVVFTFFNFVFFLFQKIQPSGGGMCIAVRKNIFDQIGGFKPHLTFDDIEFIRNASKGNKFGIVLVPVFPSDRRFAKYGLISTTLKYLILSAIFLLGLYNFSNKVDYKFGKYNNDE